MTAGLLVYSFPYLYDLPLVYHCISLNAQSWGMSFSREYIIIVEFYKIGIETMQFSQHTHTVQLNRTGILTNFDIPNCAASFL